MTTLTDNMTRRVRSRITRMMTDDAKCADVYRTKDFSSIVVSNIHYPIRMTQSNLYLHSIHNSI